MENIYIPYDNINQFSCYYIVDKDTIRGYVENPRVNSTINYTDFYINSHYLAKNGSQQFGQYSVLPTCIDKNLITNEIYYRNDFASILIIFLIMCIFCFLIPFKIFIRIFRRLQ